MISTVRARRNHYETLGLTPSASDEEIARAYAREIRAPRPSAFGGLVEVSVAYETLRDPARRRAHDVALGLNREPARPAYSATARWAGTFVGAAVARPMRDVLPAPAPSAQPPEPAPELAKPKLPAEPEAAPFIAASPPDPVRPQPEPPRAPDPVTKIEPQASRAQPSGQVEELHWDEAEHRTVEWKRPAIIVGVPVAAVVLIGAVLGWQAGKGEEQPQVTTALPPAKPRPATAMASPPAASEPAYSVAEVQPHRFPRAAVRIKHSRAAPTPSEDPLAAQPEPSQVADSVAEPVAVAQAPAVETAAAMPLPRAVIARTIHRIGYACGEVASTSAVEGARGVYYVTCSSGATYQAKPVRGRYHFRRVGSR